MLGNLIRRLCGALQRNIILVGLFYALILGAILYPITPHRTKSRATTCFSNVKQAALGLWMYSHDYDDHFPRATECMDSTYPYVKDKSVYRCPQNHSTRPTDFGYAFNASLSLKSLDNYKTPEKVVMLYGMPTHRAEREWRTLPDIRAQTSSDLQTAMPSRKVQWFRTNKRHRGSSSNPGRGAFGWSVGQGLTAGVT